ncbi:MAG: putative hydrolase YxeP [Verrucomicrobia subdivision 3 bacterium]|nr:putative hydrolase YxeP [Limisphaerales bacterium]MCS1413492.1 putative hydrolase YxeP [Limisphaerales bacterium]
MTNAIRLDIRPSETILAISSIWCCCIFLAGFLNSIPANGAKIHEQVAAKTTDAYPELLALYQHLHAHPELSFQEEQTAARLISELTQHGFKITPNIGGHGFVALLQNGPGPTILLRTDLDALPLVEETGLSYASKVRVMNEFGAEVGVMHACGHDIHMTVFTGTARLLAELKSEWSGTLVMIGQPAEEKGAGAKAMLEDGLFQRFPKPDYCLALHVNAGMPAGTVGYVPGYALANVESVNIVLRGIGGHGAWPHTTKDPIVLAAQTVMVLQTIVSREIPPTEAAVVTVGSIHGGTKHNIIPNEVKLQLTLRSYSDEVRTQTLRSIRRIVRGLAQAAGVPEDRLPIIETSDQYTPSTYNDPKLVERLAKVFKTTFGEEHCRQMDPVMGGEDFGRYGRTEDKIPICIFWLGSVSQAILDEAAQKAESPPSLHSSRYYPLPEPTIQTGVRAMTHAALELLKR